MSTPSAALPRTHRPGGPREIPRHVSPGLWTLAWRRLRADRVAMVSLGIVIAFLVMMVLSGTGLVASDWSREVGVNYAPPSFIGAQESFLAGAAGPGLGTEGTESRRPPPGRSRGSGGGAGSGGTGEPPFAARF